MGWLPWNSTSSGRTDSVQDDKNQPHSPVEGDGPQRDAVPDGSLAADRAKATPTAANIPKPGSQGFKDHATQNIDSYLDKQITPTKKKSEPATNDAHHKVHANVADNLDSLREDGNRSMLDAPSEESARPRSHAGLGTANTAEETTANDCHREAQFRTETAEKTASADDLRSRSVKALQKVKHCDTVFMSSVERLLQQVPETFIGSLLGDFKRLEQARADLELELQAWEICDQEVVAAESVLLEKEKLLDEARLNSAVALPRTVSRSNATPMDSHESQISSHNLRADKSPEAQQYLSQVGEVDLLREDLMNLEVEYAQILQDQAMRDVIGQSLDEHSQEFLETFEREREKLMSLLQQAELLQSQLRRKIPGMETDSSSQHDIARVAQSDSLPSRGHSFLGREQYIDNDLAYSLAIEDPKARAAMELIFTGQEERLPVYSGVVVMEDGGTADKSSYINAWLSHLLQTLSTEGAQHQHTQTANGVDIDLTEHNNPLLTHWTAEDSKGSDGIDAPSSERRNASIATNDGRDLASKPASDSRGLAGNTKQHFKLRFDARSAHSAK